MKVVLIVLIALALIAVGFSIYARQAANNEAAQTTTQQTQNTQSESSTPAKNEGSKDHITEAQAIEIASVKMPGKTYEKVEIETENGIKIYSVRFTDGSRVDVRATDGEVVSTE